MSRKAGQFLKLIAGPGHTTEDDSTVPLQFRDQAMPGGGSGPSQPQAGQPTVTVTGPSAKNHEPLPL